MSLSLQTGRGWSLSLVRSWRLETAAGMNFHMQPEHGIPRLRQGGGVLAAAGQVLETGGWSMVNLSRFLKTVFFLQEHLELAEPA